MSDLIRDIEAMHAHHDVHPCIKQFSLDQLRAFLEFRIAFVREEYNELVAAKTAEDAVDALIDITVIAIGTLDLMQVDITRAWQKVHAANMAKQVGVTSHRSNLIGLPDLVKPEGWIAPDHAGNVGLFAKLFHSGEPNADAV